MTRWGVEHADRARGALMGLAVGDALGAAVEFQMCKVEGTDSEFIMPPSVELRQILTTVF
jgi:hypothetical protein